MALVGKSNEEKIWNYLKSKGLNDYGVAGCMGNLFCESGLNPKNLENVYERRLGYSDEEYCIAVDNGTYTNFIHDAAGFGIAQWTYFSRKKALYEYAKNKKKSICDLEIQLEFLYKELSDSYKSVLTTLKTAKSVREASNAVLLKFECPADQSISMQDRRASYGQNYYNKYAKNGNKEGEIVMGYKTCTKGRATKLSSNFSSTEFDCHGHGCCSQTLINDKLVEYVQKIRDHFKKPITITSAYRCSIHNKNIGGATGSRHSKGDAADIVVKGVTPREVAKYAESIGIKGIGLYETSQDGHFVHIDTRTSKSFWYGQAQAYRSTFGGTTSVTTANTGDNKINTVKEVQKWLKSDYNADIIDDGVYGPKTKASLIKVLQKAFGVKQDGIYGDKTIQAVKTLSKGCTGEAVKALQGLLVCNGHTGAYVDGHYGLGTYNAVIDFQKSKNLLQKDGVAGKITFGLLCK